MNLQVVKQRRKERSRRDSRSSPATDPPAAEPERQDLFSSTLYTMINELIDGDEEAGKQLTNHIMETYRRPLRIYFLGSSWRHTGWEADEVIAGFFESRLKKPDFMLKWRESRRPLRFWLLTSLTHYLFETHADQKRDQATIPAQKLDAPQREARDPRLEYDREYIREQLRAAMQNAAEICESKNISKYWIAMIRHHVDGMPLSSIQTEIQATNDALKKGLQRARGIMRQVYRNMVSWPGATDEEIDQEIQRMMEIIAS